MNAPGSDTLFVGSIPELYDTLVVPLIFQPYADDMARRVAVLAPLRVLETAAGTGVVTRAMARALPAHVAIVATDLNQPMLNRAAVVGAGRDVHWQQADAMQLPFDDASFDAVVCQFGAMFFPDKAHAFAQARRVLRPGGTLLFNVWDRLEDNELADLATATLAGLFPADPPRFMARTPHGWFDTAVIAREVASAGFTEPARIDTVTARSRAASARVAAMAYCQGTPLRNEIETRQGVTLSQATAACEAAFTKRFGTGEIDTKIQAHVVTVRR